MIEPGHNNPPSMIDTIAEVANDLSAWMADHPVISSLQEAAEAKVFIDRAKLGIKDLEDERDSKVRPLNEQVKAVNESYKEPRRLVDRVLGELQSRIGAFIRLEEQKRIRAAEEARRILEKAEAAAREAEKVERERLADAAAGELDIDVSGVTREADKAFGEYQKAERQAAIAEKETKVKITGGFSRAIGLKTETTLVVSDIMAAVAAMKTSEHIIEAVLKSARAYKKVVGEYPPGITTETERKI